MVNGSFLYRRDERRPLPLDTEGAPAATCTHVALPSSNRMNEVRCPSTSTQAIPNRCATSGVDAERKFSEIDETFERQHQNVTIESAVVVAPTNRARSHRRVDATARAAT